LTHYVGPDNAKQIVGWRQPAQGSGLSFIYADGRFHFIDTPDGAHVNATDIGEQGWVVGGWEGHSGFLYRDNHIYAFEDPLRPGVANH
jgi:hypothetical protein